MRGSNVIAAMVLLAGFMEPAAAQNRVALVIGNDRYENVPVLQKAANDARTVGDHFAQLGYDVIRAENATRRQMNEKIGELTARIGRGDTAAFFFAGHGVAILLRRRRGSKQERKHWKKYGLSSARRKRRPRSTGQSGAAESPESLPHC